ncbi:hypothetical protein PSI15_03515 [Xenorhabdus sp. PR6a]|nr:hypothetical protein [Xenorhabdus sp. PR6a]MDC9580645.1 hypothetical protein [Xenorhabdus sp. PR6a]
MSGSDMIIKENGWIGGDERDITDSTTPRQGMGLLFAYAFSCCVD